MPLAFPSLSHGTVAFGFYNIETDGLLLDRHFFFCTDFCEAVCSLAAGGQAGLPAWTFADAAAVGDLMGAIHGLRLTGYLGAVYRRWPFPADPAAFRQKLYGADNRAATEALLAPRAPAHRLPLARQPDGVIAIGEHRFSAPQFAALLAYVDRGGHPTWQGRERGERPACVAAMVAAWAGQPGASGAGGA